MQLPYGQKNLEDYEELYERFQVLKKLKNNMPLFGRVCFASAISKEVAPFHYEICKSLGALDKKRVLVSAPRGSAKSTWFNLIYPMWRIAFKSTGEDIFIVIISEAQSQSINFLSRIKYHLNTSEKFKELFGDLGEKTAARWTNNDVILANGVRIVALGTGQRVRGFIEGDTRPTDIIIDDFESELNANTPEARSKNRTWALNAVFPSVSDNGRILMVGTPISEDCFLYYAKDSKVWDSHWFAVCDDLQSALDGDEDNAGLLWRAKYDCQRISEIYDEFKNTGNVHGFYQEYMCQPQSPGEAPFQESYFKDYKASLERKGSDWYLAYGSGEGETLVPIDLYMGVDPASSLSIKADFFVIAVVGVDSHDNRYLVDIFRDRIRPSEQPQKIIDWYKRYRPRKTKIETTAYQEALRDGVRALMRDGNLFIPGLESGLKPRNPKSERLLSLVPHFARGKFYFRPEHRAVKLEFTSYPRGKHDDAMDAIWTACQGMSPCKRTAEKDETKRERSDTKKYDWMSDF